MNAIPAALTDPRPLTTIGRPAGDRLRVRRSVLLAGGGWLATAATRTRDQLALEVGLTRCSPIFVAAYPPDVAAAALADVEDVDQASAHGAQLALQACATGSCCVPLWLFVAWCEVLWPQRAPVMGLS